VVRSIEVEVVVVVVFLDGSIGRGRGYSRGKIGGKAEEVLSSTTNVA